MLDPVIRVGLRELRQDPSELVRRVEAGEEVTITVAGRPAARMVPIAPRRWRSYAELVELFSGRVDAAWPDDGEQIDGAVRNPRTVE
jgi:prevent-host-death family protein